MRAIALLAVMLLSTQLADADATTPSEPPVAAPVCRDATGRGIERAFAAWCRAHPSGGVHGTCAEWLRAYRRCESVVFERDAPAWLVVLKLFDCHDPIVAVVPDGKRWRVREVTMRSLLPTPPPPDLDDLR